MFLIDKLSYFIFADDEYYECDIKCFTVAENGTHLLECSDGFEIFVIWANIGWDSTFQCEAVVGYFNFFYLTPINLVLSFCQTVTLRITSLLMARNYT